MWGHVLHVGLEVVPQVKGKYHLSHAHQVAGRGMEMIAPNTHFKELVHVVVEDWEKKIAIQIEMQYTKESG